MSDTMGLTPPVTSALTITLPDGVTPPAVGATWGLMIVRSVDGNVITVSDAATPQERSEAQAAWRAKFPTVPT